MSESDTLEAPKPKRVQTEAQKENFRKAVAARAANVAARNETKDERIITKKLNTLATKAEKLKAKIPLKPEPEPEESEDEPEIVVIRKKSKPKPKKRIVVVEESSSSDDEVSESVQKPKSKPKPKPIDPVPIQVRQQVSLPFNNLRFY